MIPQLLGWTTFGVTIVAAVLVSYVLVTTARNPTAWANRVVVAKLPDEPFTVPGDDIVGLLT